MDEIFRQDRVELLRNLLKEAQENGLIVLQTNKLREQKAVSVQGRPKEIISFRNKLIDANICERVALPKQHPKNRNIDTLYVTLKFNNDKKFTNYEGKNTKRNKIREKRSIEECIKLLEIKGIKYFYHFTDKKNIKSIKDNRGLYSWCECGKKGIKIINQGGNELSRNLDVNKGLQDYVRLSLYENLPMKHILQRRNKKFEPINIMIKKEVLYIKDTLISDKNATDNNAIIGSVKNCIDNIRFDIINNGKWKNEIEKQFIQAEVLIKNHIPLEYIINI